MGARTWIWVTYVGRLARNVVGGSSADGYGVATYGSSTYGT